MYQRTGEEEGIGGRGEGDGDMVQENGSAVGESSVDIFDRGTEKELGDRHEKPERKGRTK